MALPTFPALVKRLVKGSPLTHAEGDGNLDAIKAYCQMLADLFGLSLNADGTLTADSVDTLQIKNRSVIESKLGPISVFPTKEDIGATNAMKIAFVPPLTTYGDGQVFFVLVVNPNTGPATLQVDSLDIIDVKKIGGVELALGDYTAGVIALAYMGGIFHLIAGSSSSSSSSSSTGFSGFRIFEPADVAIMADTTSTTFTHGLNVVPDFRGHLVNVSNDLGFVGQLVPLFEFTDGAGNPAFAISANSAAVKVERNAASIELAGLGAIDTTKWMLRVRAEAKTSVSPPIFPDLSFTFKWPQLAIANGNDLFVATVGPTSVTSTFRVNLATNEVTRILPAASGPNYTHCNSAPFKLADGTEHALFTSLIGFYDLPLLESVSWQPTRLSSAPVNLYGHKPVHFEESSGITNVYVVPSSFASAFPISSLPMWNVTISAGTAVAVGVNVDLTNVNILNADDTPGNSVFIAFNPTPSSIKSGMFQYNRIKKRMYVVTNESDLMFIFEIQDAGFADPGSILEWWNIVGTTRYSKLKFIKVIAIPGSGSASSDTDRENYVVDFDLTTGEERALVFNRTGNNTVAGSVTRVPWKES